MNRRRTAHKQSVFRVLSGTLWLLVGALQGIALDPTKTLTQYNHRVWNQEEGLLDPTVYSLMQARDGYLWLGTQNGLIRFDGERFRPLRLPGGNTAGEPALIRSLYQDKHDVVWAGSIGSGLLRSARQHRTWFNTHNSLLPSDIVTCVVPHGDNGLWLCTIQGLVDFQGKPTKVYTTADGLPSNRISSTCQATDGTQWVSTYDGGLSRSVNGKFERYRNAVFGLDGEIRTLLCADNGFVWAGTDHGVYRLKADSAQRFTAENGLADNSVLSLLPDHNGGIWIGTQTGISRFSHNEWSTYRTRDGLSHTTVLSLLVDREGSLWAGTKNGLDQFTDSRVTPYTVSEGMPTNDVGPIVEDQEGILWIGTRGSGLVRFDGHTFSRISEANGLLQNNVLSLLAASDGDLWVGTEKGLNRLRSGKIVGSYRPQPGLIGNQITSLFVDSKGLLWVGTDQGLWLWQAGRFVKPPQFQQLSTEPIVALGGGRSTRLAVSTRAGYLYSLRNGEVIAYTPAGPTRPIAAYYPNLNRHTMWMGTLGSGLIRFKNGTLTHLRMKDGLFDDQIYAMLADDSQNLWFASSKGIFRVSQDQLEDVADGKRKNVESLPFSTGQLRFECQSGVQPAAFKTRDGRLWFSTTNGLVAVDPNHLRPNTLPPPAQIEAVFINGERRETDSTLELAPSEKNLEIRYAGLSFVTPEKVTFRYILDGYEKGWVEAGNRREAFYTNLPPGRFRFRVIACNSDGVWSTQGAAVDFTIEPLPYQRPWFFPLCGLFIGLLVWLGYQLHIRRLKSQFNLVLTERTRIARELHDTLLQGLSGITMQLQALWTRLPSSDEKHVLQDIIKDAGTCLTEARHSLWGLRSPRSADSGFAEKLAQSARTAVAGRPIRLVLQIARIGCQLSPEVEYQLLRIAQEAIANSVRHAAPQTLEVRFESKGAEEIELAIRDDGKGFNADVEYAQFGHYGLVGIRERADEIGAKLVIASMRGLGTEVLVKVHAPNQATELDTLPTAQRPEPAERRTI